MSESDEIVDEEGVAGKVSAVVQKIIGEIEEIGGVLTGDPITQAEGEYNVAASEIRGEIEEDLEEKPDDEHPAGGSW